eukprot:TRINITY_DN54174_c0_g1_i1.p1 TRINITY_DN54174_c0_g1~~TRINITY_DN54174_c0_g1_i1.p1  ORF type:complete len:205 (+),score=26.13 TRINITY_DN54174_c0_g1_i1:91-705(+)
MSNRSYDEAQRILSASNYFEVLDLRLSSDITVYDVKRAYKRIIINVHPDKCSHPKADKAFDELQRAHKLLSDEDVLETFIRGWKKSQRKSGWDVRQKQEELEEVHKRKRSPSPENYETHLRKRRYGRMDSLEREIEQLEEEKQERERRRWNIVKQKEEAKIQDKEHKSLGQSWSSWVQKAGKKKKGTGISKSARKHVNAADKFM